MYSIKTCAPCSYGDMGYGIFKGSHKEFKFPISVLHTQTQVQHRCQKIRKFWTNSLAVSNFATRQLNLRKPQRWLKFCKKYIFFC